MHRIGVCSWSLRPKWPEDLVKKVHECGLSAVQLALDPIRTGSWREAETSRALSKGGITILSGMMAMEGEDYSTLESIRHTGGVRPDEAWDDNLQAATQNAEIAKRLGIRLVTFHAGFFPENPMDKTARKMLARLATVTDVFASRGIDVGFETGQESPKTLLDVIGDIKRHSAGRMSSGFHGVNFDPANMILYGSGEPTAALAMLAPAVKQVHIKDAIPTTQPGTWGTEVVAGTGAVDWPWFFRVIEEKLPNVNLVIEREAGEGREADVRAAKALIERMLSDPEAEPWVELHP